jgi:L-rhamnose isomerase
MFPQLDDTQIQNAYANAKEIYAKYGVDTEEALKKLATIPLSMHCWQGDDVTGFEGKAEKAGGGTMVTGNYMGRARTIGELRADIEKAWSLIPGTHRLNLHAIYADTGDKKVDRNELQPEHFASWADWAKAQGAGIDFNPTFFGHAKADDGFTLSSYDAGIREFWIEHGIACRKIAAFFGEQLGTPAVTNFWIPDGFKDVPVDRMTPRALLTDSLDKCFAEKLDPGKNLDAVESKLFGIGAESYTTGSHEYYLGYAVSRGKLLCLDAGHFHPTEVISDKLSAVMLFVDELLLHVSRPVRWDSDHVVILNDELRAIAHELVAHDILDRVHIGLDFFDASINRIAAWTIGMRAMLKALLIALLEPMGTMKGYEKEGDFTARLAMMEELKELPFGAVWDYYCAQQGVPAGAAWLNEVKQYEQSTLAKRD